MSNLLKVTIIQADLVWENAIQNRQDIEGKILALEEPTDLIILPEMFTTGFAMQPERLAETMNGDTVVWMLKMAKEHNSAICGSIIITENEHHYNRFLFVTPSGEIHQYNKRHLFSLAGEHERYQNDNKQVIINYKGWKICPLICYDLRFPVWSRNTLNYDVLIYVANWPKPRIDAWNTLLKARAIENMSYVVGVNRVGTDANGHEYTGNSIVLDELGAEMTPLAENTETYFTTTLSKEKLLASRTKFNFLSDQDKFEIK
jgi:predicted amidohydrolase